MKEFWQLYGFILLIIFGFLLFIATTVGVAVAAVVLCVVFKTGWYAFMLTALLFTIPFWICLCSIIKESV